MHKYEKVSRMKSIWKWGTTASSSLFPHSSPFVANGNLKLIFNWFQIQGTGGPCNMRSFYLQFWVFSIKFIIFLYVGTYLPIPHFYHSFLYEPILLAISLTYNEGKLSFFFHTNRLSCEWNRRCEISFKMLDYLKRIMT